jgi:hypothetical protein
MCYCKLILHFFLVLYSLNELGISAQPMEVAKEKGGHGLKTKK